MPEQQNFVGDIEAKGEFDTVEDNGGMFFAQNPEGPKEEWNVPLSEILDEQ